MLKKRLLLNSFVVLCCIILPACYKKNHKSPAPYSYNEQPQLLFEAHLTDIPLPVQADVRVLHGSTAENTGLTFVSCFELVDIIRFYQLEMERLGWQELHLFNLSPEVLLVFEKPQKFCTVSIRPDNRVVLFFGTRS